MAKYDFELDLSENTSTGLILKRLTPGMKILEFGCANGRMTKYMKEQMNCKVWAVEYDTEAYEEARQYAEGGVCGDILEWKWEEEFSAVAFDAILFVDVLEHLSMPEETIVRASNLLSASGKIYVSIPNITHNDVILKALANRFDYTSVGLLDDTHIHFWGLENIYELAKRVKLNLATIDATYCESGKTEQFAGYDTELAKSGLTKSILRKHAEGEVYQYVFCLSKEAGGKTEENIIQRTIKSRLYIDRGNGFCEEDCEIIEAVIKDSSFSIDLPYEADSSVKGLRLDPIEGEGCILTDVSILKSNSNIEFDMSEGIYDDEMLVLLGDDPKLVFRCEDYSGSYLIRMNVMLIGDEYIEYIQKGYLSSVNQLNMEKKRCVNLNCSVENLESKVFNLSETLKNTSSSMKIVADSLEIVKEELGNTRSELSVVRNELNNANAELGNIKNELDNTRNVLHETQDELSVTFSELNNTREELSNVRNELNSTQDELRDTKYELGNTVSELSNVKEELSSAADELNQSKNNLLAKQAELDNALDELSSIEGELRNTNTELFMAKEEVNSLTLVAQQYEAALAENASLRKQLENQEALVGAYIGLVNNKDEYIIELKNQIEHDERILNRYESYAYIKLRHFAAKILRKIKNVFKKR